MVTALNVFYANAASTTLTTADQLYFSTGSGGSPTNVATYTVFGTGLGWVELQPQGSSQTPVGAIGSPSGKGFLWDVTTLEGQQLVSGNYGGIIRLNASQFSGGSGLTQAGTLTADVVVRVYKRSSGGVYTNIVTMTLTAQSIVSAFTSYTLPSTAGSTTSFSTGDKLYTDAWANVTANANGSAAQGIRFNRLSTDTTTFVGDTQAIITTPGYQATSGGSTPLIIRQHRRTFGFVR